MDAYQWLDELLDKEMPNMTDKKKAIVKASIVLFGEKSYAATSTKEIAKMAGVSEGTIFKHFASKNELMLSIIDIIINELMTTMFFTGLPEIIAGKYENINEFLPVIVRNRLQLIDKAVPLFKILIQEIPFHPEIRTMLREKVSKIPVWELINSLPIKGLDSTKSVEEIILTLITCFGGFVQTRFIIMPEYFTEKPGYDREEDCISFIRFILRGLSLEQE